MPVLIVCVENVVARDFADCDTIGDLAGHNHKIALPDRVDELIELGSEVAKAVVPGVGHDLLQVRKDRIPILQLAQVADFKETRKEFVLFNRSKLTLTLFPCTYYSTILSCPRLHLTSKVWLGHTFFDLVQPPVGLTTLPPCHKVDLPGHGGGD